MKTIVVCEVLEDGTFVQRSWSVTDRTADGLVAILGDAHTELMVDYAKAYAMAETVMAHAVVTGQ